LLRKNVPLPNRAFAKRALWANSRIAPTKIPLAGAIRLFALRRAYFIFPQRSQSSEANQKECSTLFNRLHPVRPDFESQAGEQQSHQPVRTFAGQAALILSDDLP